MSTRSVLSKALSLLAAMAISAPALAGDTEHWAGWEHNNDWAVEISNRPEVKSPLFVTLKQVGEHWEIDGLFTSPPKIPRNQKLELFMVTRDFQRWSNAYVDRVINCDTFEAREADFHSVCTSALSEKQSAGSAAVGMLFGGSGSRPIVYNREKVAAAIHSIRVEQATTMLTAFEQGK